MSLLPLWSNQSNHFQIRFSQDYGRLLCLLTNYLKKNLNSQKRQRVLVDVIVRKLKKDPMVRLRKTSLLLAYSIRKGSVYFFPSSRKLGDIDCRRGKGGVPNWKKLLLIYFYSWSFLLPLDWVVGV